MPLDPEEKKEIISSVQSDLELRFGEIGNSIAELKDVLSQVKPDPNATKLEQEQDAIKLSDISAKVDTMMESFTELKTGLTSDKPGKKSLLELILG